MNEDIETLKTILSSVLSDKLPGWDAQKMMAPPQRLKIKPSVSSVPDKSYHNAAVLVCLCPFFPSKNELKIIMIKRTSHPSDIHSNQIGFPGGKTEPEDLSLINTAIREFREETGCNLQPEVIGSLSEVLIPVSKFRVFPFLSFLPEIPDFSPDSSEVRKILLVPLSHLMNESNTVVCEIKPGYFVPGWKFENEFIWGASAMILAELCFILKKFFYK